MNYDVLVFLGRPFPFKNITMIYPPTIKDLAGDPLGFVYAKVLTISQEEIWDSMNNKKEQDENDPFFRWTRPDEYNTPLEELVMQANSNAEMKALIMSAFKFFTKEDVIFLASNDGIVFIKDIENITDPKDIRILTNENYHEFQNAIRQCIGRPTVPPPDLNEPKKVSEFKAKSRRRERVKSEKSKDSAGVSFIDTITSICCMNLGLSPLNIDKLSYAASQLLVDKYRRKEEYQNNISYIAGGADPKKMNIKYWIGDVED